MVQTFGSEGTVEIRCRQSRIVALLAGTLDSQPAGGDGNSSGSQGLRLGTIESHWQTETDYYAATVALDFLSFAFVALFYQVNAMLLSDKRQVGIR